VNVVFGIKLKSIFGGSNLSVYAQRRASQGSLIAVQQGDETIETRKDFLIEHREQVQTEEHTLEII